MVTKHLGSWLQSFKEILSPSEMGWWLDTYIRILEFAWQPESQGDGKKQSTEGNVDKAEKLESKRPNALTQLCISCRRMCAYNFPVIGKREY